MAEVKVRSKVRTGKCPRNIGTRHVVPEERCAFGGNARHMCGINTCLICEAKSFASHPRVACWSASNPKTPRMVFMSSGAKYLFDCDVCRHSFEIALDKATAGNWCPYCSGQRLCDSATCNVCRAKSFASHPRAVCWSASNSKTARMVFMSSNTKYLFDCDVCHHSFEIALCSATAGHWCPYCSNQRLCENIKCRACEAKSFASGTRAACWSASNAKSPRMVFASSNTKYSFDCDVCHHSFEIALYNVTAGNWCPYCTNQRLCENINCRACKVKSFASHPRAACWSANNAKSPRMVFMSSNKKYSFDCDVCHHSFETVLGDVAAGKWCPYCSNQRLCENIVCQACEAKSFASSPRVACWSANNSKSPRMVFMSSNKKYSFDCDMCRHSFVTALCDVTAGKWCPYCHNKTETKLFDILKVEFPDTIRQFRAPWCVNSVTDRCFPFDFVIESRRVIIELDGDQHFIQVSNWQSPELTCIRDKYKMICAWRNGYNVIRVLQRDIWNDRVNMAQLFAYIRGDHAGGSQLRICETGQTSATYAKIEAFHNLFMTNPALFDGFTSTESDHEDTESEHEDDTESKHEDAEVIEIHN